MSNITVEKVSLPAPPVNIREIIRYGGGRDEDAIRDCVREAEGVLTYNVCFAEVDASVDGGEVDLGFTRIASRDLAKNLGGRLIDVGTATQGRINPFHVVTTLDADEEESGIRVDNFAVHLQFLEEYFRVILPGIDAQALEYLKKDKKIANGKVNCIFVEEIGSFKTLSLTLEEFAELIKKSV